MKLLVTMLDQAELEKIKFDVYNAASSWLFLWLFFRCHFNGATTPCLPWKGTMNITNPTFLMVIKIKLHSGLKIQYEFLIIIIILC